MEIIRSLHKLTIGDAVEAALRRLKDHHPARPVRSIAGHVYEEMFTHARQHHQKPR